jgi:DNA polymerase III subunit epsilon
LDGKEARACGRDNEVVVLDFETSGMSPLRGDRAIEIGAVRIVGDDIVERFQSLINPGRRIDAFIENLTGISNRMIAQAPPAAEVMAAFSRFIGDRPLVAHNAAFDGRFLEAELTRIGRRRRQGMICSMLVARRLYPQAPNHKLATLVEYKGLPAAGRFHRALADAEMTAHLWLCMARELRSTLGVSELPLELWRRLATLKKERVARFLHEQAALVGSHTGP